MTKWSSGTRKYLFCFLVQIEQLQKCRDQGCCIKPRFFTLQMMLYRLHSRISRQSKRGEIKKRVLFSLLALDDRDFFFCVHLPPDCPAVARSLVKHPVHAHLSTPVVIAREPL
jgi:hypothetical protein